MLEPFTAYLIVVLCLFPLVAMVVGLEDRTEPLPPRWGPLARLRALANGELLITTTRQRWFDIGLVLEMLAVVHGLIYGMICAVSSPSVFKLGDSVLIVMAAVVWNLVILLLTLKQPPRVSWTYATFATAGLHVIFWLFR